MPETTTKTKRDPDVAAIFPLEEGTGKKEFGRTLELIRGGPRAYLWICGAESGCYGTVSGVGALRRLAKSILRELDSERPPRRTVAFAVETRASSPASAPVAGVSPARSRPNLTECVA
jgi:hypothetical protein